MKKINIILKENGSKIIVITALLAFIVFLQKNYDSIKSMQINSITGDTKTKISHNVYFDLGTNNGDSIESFIGLSDIQAHGGNIRDQIPAEKLTSRWKIYAVEGNSKFDPMLFEIKNKYSKSHDIILFNGTVVTTYDGFIKFYLDNENTKIHPLHGSSINENHFDVVRSNKQFELKPCIDFARLLKQYDEDDFIIVKMDVEGAEFDLLIHLIKQNALQLIDVFIVEYHNFVSPFKTPVDVFNRIYKSFDIKIAKWE